MTTDNVNAEVTEPQTPAPEAAEPSGGTQPASDPAPSTPPQDNKAGSEPTIPISRFNEVIAERNRLREQVKQPQQPQQPTQPASAPKVEDYPDFDAYQAAVIDYRVQQGIQGYEQRQRQAIANQQFQDRAQKATANWAKEYTKAQTADPASVALIDSAAVPLRPDLSINLMEHANPIALAKHLALNPEQTMEINGLPPDLAVRRMWEIGQSLAGSKTQPVSASKAPPPISPVGSGKTNTAGGYRADMSQQEYNAAFPPIW